MQSLSSRPTDYVTDYAYHAGRVKRYHSWVVHHCQTIGEHCWGVALVYEQIFGPPTATVERFIRHHDTAELVVGDPPFPVKMENPDLKAGYDRIEPAALERMGVTQLPDLSERERVQVKIADLLEMMLLGMTEREMGNLLAAPIVIRTERVAEGMATERLSAEAAGDVREWIYRQWVRHEAVMSMADHTLNYRYERRRRL